MIVISYGMVKSASSFTFQLIQDLVKNHIQSSEAQLHSVGGLLPYINGNFVSDEFELEAVILDITNSENFSDGDWVVIKTHSKCDGKTKKLLTENDIKATANFRDPAEIALSLRDVVIKENKEGINRFNKKYLNISKSINSLKYHENNFLSWYSNQNTLPIFYDSLVMGPDDVVKLIADHLGFASVSPKTILKNYEDRNKIREFNKGVINRAESELSASQISSIQEQCPKLMELVHSHRASLFNAAGNLK